jgi:hypothetical protein
VIIGDFGPHPVWRHPWIDTFGSAPSRSAISARTPSARTPFDRFPWIGPPRCGPSRIGPHRLGSPGSAHSAQPPPALPGQIGHMACRRLGRFWRFGSRRLRSSAAPVLSYSGPRYMLLWHSVVLSLFGVWFRLDPSIASAIGAPRALPPPSVLGRSDPCPFGAQLLWTLVWSTGTLELWSSEARLSCTAIPWRSPTVVLGLPVLTLHRNASRLDAQALGGRSDPRPLWSLRRSVDPALG